MSFTRPHGPAPRAVSHFSRLPPGGRPGRVPAHADSRPNAERTRALCGNRANHLHHDGWIARGNWTCSGYLWAGPASPLSGKDKIATLEADPVEDKKVKHETKNPYFARSFTSRRMPVTRSCANSEVDPAEGLIVNGYMCRSKWKRANRRSSGAARPSRSTARFPSVYGDRRLHAGAGGAAHHPGWEHSHFESVEAASATCGADIIPKITILKEWSVPKRVADSERGAGVERSASSSCIAFVEAYESHAILPPNS